MKRRIIRANTGKAYPESYIQLQRAMQDLRHQIDATVDYPLESFADWDGLSALLLSSINAIGRCCEKLEGEVTSSTKIVGAGNVRSFIQFDESFAEVPEDAWYMALRVPSKDYEKLSDNVKELIGEYALLRGEDEERYMYIDVDDRLNGESAEVIEQLAAEGISRTNPKYELIKYTEVWS